MKRSNQNRKFSDFTNTYIGASVTALLICPILPSTFWYLVQKCSKQTISHKKRKEQETHIAKEKYMLQQLWKSHRLNKNLVQRQCTYFLIYDWPSLHHLESKTDFCSTDHCYQIPNNNDWTKSTFHIQNPSTHTIIFLKIPPNHFYLRRRSHK